MACGFALNNILVTGGCGFVGSAFVRHVVREHPGVRVTVLDALTYAGNPQNIACLPRNRAELVVGDACDAKLVRDLVAKTDAVVHFAAETHNDRSIADPAPFVKTNVEGTFTLIEACRQLGVRYHHISTDEVFGDLPLDSPARFTEESPYRSSSPHSSSKATADMFAIGSTLRTTVLRCGRFLRAAAWARPTLLVLMASATTFPFCASCCGRLGAMGMILTGCATERAMTVAMRLTALSCAALGGRLPIRISRPALPIL